MSWFSVPPMILGVVLADQPFEADGCILEHREIN